MQDRHAASRLGAVAMAFLLLTSAATQAEDSSQPALSADPPAFQPYTPPPQKAAALARWRDASFGLFLHFGVYSTFGGEYEGRRSGAYGEWLMHDVKIPLAEYRKKVAGVFNPTEFNADEWVRIAKETGMRYLVVTAKHHDGCDVG